MSRLARLRSALPTYNARLSGGSPSPREVHTSRDPNIAYRPGRGGTSDSATANVTRLPESRRSASSLGSVISAFGSPWPGIVNAVRLRSAAAVTPLAHTCGGQPSQAAGLRACGPPTRSSRPLWRYGGFGDIDDYGGLPYASARRNLMTATRSRPMHTSRSGPLPYADSLTRAAETMPPDSPDRRNLLDLAHLLEGERYLTTGQAARLLGVMSPTTVKNWLHGGHFPGARRTPGGHWQFPLFDVLSVRDALQTSKERNRRGDLRVARAAQPFDPRDEPAF